MTDDDSPRGHKSALLHGASCANAFKFITPIGVVCVCLCAVFNHETAPAQPPPCCECNRINLWCLFGWVWVAYRKKQQRKTLYNVGVRNRRQTCIRFENDDDEEHFGKERDFCNKKGNAEKMLIFFSNRSSRFEFNSATARMENSAPENVPPSHSFYSAS